MYSTICTNNKNEDKEVAGWITVGFTGMLKGWWDNILTTNQRQEILNAVKTTETGTIKQDAVYTLVQSIILHFVGHWDNQRERSRELLQNLKCPTLTHFRWYKDVFLAKVMQRIDANSEHWKSKFVDGLPYFFAEKIRKKLRDQNNGLTIDYNRYTYGQLIAIIIQEGLTLCNDIKLHNQLKKQNLTGKQELGQFCDQFGYDVPQYSKPQKNKNSNKATRKSSKKKYGKKKHKDRDEQSSSKNPKNTARKQKNKKGEKEVSAKCFKCGRLGHYANKCKTKKKLEELQLDEGLKQTLYKLLIDSSDSDSEDQINDLPENEDTSSTLEEEEITNDCNCNNMECSTSDDY
ncbi:uncharacterized protein LOC131299598 [Rhododendron vialii]|uniref:uncharacterized protein LOC131299598 n=1 Tax=Rhododendron vialii TaxID=182163 RepID=UPI00265E6175|nr:uncharacterized protein LOC131299598 [Rhododendron vialii]